MYKVVYMAVGEELLHAFFILCHWGHGGCKGIKVSKLYEVSRRALRRILEGR
jgi:hypothetical protein